MRLHSSLRSQGAEEMNAAHTIFISPGDFDHSVEIGKLRAVSNGIGAVVTFTGLVRDNNLDDGVTGLFLEHYPGMTEKSILAILDEAASRWELIASRVIHRVGPLTPGDQIVFVGACSPHRADAFAATDFIMDYLKTRAPFWKKELTEVGERWLETRQSDVDAAARWRR